MMSDRFDGGDKDFMILLVVNITADVDKEAPTSNNSKQIVGLKVRQSKRAEDPDITMLTMMQMREEAEDRAHDCREKVEDQREMAKD